MQIPSFLSHLRTDSKGRPVPYINKWGTEDPSKLSVRYDHNIRKRAIFDDDSQETVPDFTRQNMQRQREIMALGLCQVCGSAVPYSRRTLVLSGVSVEEIAVRDTKTAAVFEPWLCVRCALFAVDKCPALIRRRRDEDLHVFPIRSPRDFTLAISVGSLDGHPDTVSDPVGMWVKIIINPEVLTLKQR